MNDSTALRQLLDGFFIDAFGQLEWSFIDGCTVEDVLGKELSDYLIKIKQEEH